MWTNGVTVSNNCNGIERAAADALHKRVVTTLRSAAIAAQFSADWLKLHTIGTGECPLRELNSG